MNNHEIYVACPTCGLDYDIRLTSQCPECWTGKSIVTLTSIKPPGVTIYIPKPLREAITVE